ncbi:Uncharacterised protein [Bordetella pertussis]|nr:Uncharacterised protein [Bordetella pertussis]CPL27251.1 Uncharacterised protein [Bordetella pertussis]CPN19256.1 Uncharacterised protein [Bordetella pertussis]
MARGMAFNEAFTPTLAHMPTTAWQIASSLM